MSSANELDLNKISPPTAALSTTIDDHCWRHNSKIHQLYTSQDFVKCQDLIEQVLRQTKGQCEFALFIKAKIRRQMGCINESLELFQAAAALNPFNIEILKEVGRSLYLLGRFESALQLYDQIESLQETERWDIIHQKGLCLWRLRRLPDALECFQNANQIQRHDATFMMLGQVHVELGQYAQAADVYSEAME